MRTIHILVFNIPLLATKLSTKVGHSNNSGIEHVNEPDHTRTSANVNMGFVLRNFLHKVPIRPKETTFEIIWKNG